MRVEIFLLLLVIIAVALAENKKNRLSKPEKLVNIKVSGTFSCGKIPFKETFVQLNGFSNRVQTNAKGKFTIVAWVSNFSVAPTVALFGICTGGKPVNTNVEGCDSMLYTNPKREEDYKFKFGDIDASTKPGRKTKCTIKNIRQRFQLQKIRKPVVTKVNGTFMCGNKPFTDTRVQLKKSKMTAVRTDSKGMFTLTTNETNLCIPPVIILYGHCVNGTIFNAGANRCPAAHYKNPHRIIGSYYTLNTVDASKNPGIRAACNGSDKSTHPNATSGMSLVVLLPVSMSTTVVILVVILLSIYAYTVSRK